MTRKITPNISVWKWLSDASTAYSILPPAGVGAVTSLLAHLAELEPVWIALIGLLGAAASLAIFRLSSSTRIAWAFHLVIALCLGITLWRDYNKYEIDFIGLDNGLVPENLYRDSAQGVVVTMKFHNPNKYPIFLRVERYILKVEDTDIIDRSKPEIIRVDPNRTFGLGDQPVKLAAPLMLEQVSYGFIDSTVCYGRNEDDLKKGWEIQVSFAGRINADGTPETTYAPKSVRRISCN